MSPPLQWWDAVHGLAPDHRVHRIVSRAFMTLVLATPMQAQRAPSIDGRTRLTSDTAGGRGAIFTSRDLLHLGEIAGLALGAATIDRSVAVHERDHPTSLYHTLDDLAQNQGFAWVTRPGVWVVPGALYTYGRLADQPDIADVGIHSVESVGAAMLITGGLKILLGRAQPVSVGDTLTTDFKAGGGFRTFARQSFPSGDASIAFAMASSMSAEVHRLWPGATPLVSTLMYGGATAVAISRLNDNNHWLSDIVFGAGLGTLTGLKVVEFAHAHPRNSIDAFLLAARVVPNSDGSGVTVALVFPTR